MKVAAFVVAFATAASAVKNVLPPPKSLYKVEWESQELIDHGRLDPFNSSHLRRLMISRFKPVLLPLCTKTCRVPYMPPAIADLSDEIMEAFLVGTTWPKGVLATLEMEVCCKSFDLPFSYLLPQFPKILFGTGFNTTRHFYSATAQQLASLGYEVIVMDHPYETDVIQYADGEIVFGGRVAKDIDDIPDNELGLRIRSDDATFVMDRLGIKQTVFIGHSFGGAAAADLMAREEAAHHRVMGGVNLDGRMFGPGLRNGVERPFMVWGSEGHNSSNEASFVEFFEAMKEKHPKVWTRELNTKESLHLSYADFSVIGDVAGLRNDKTLEDNVLGRLKGARAMELMKRYLGTFVEFTLHGRDKGVLRGPTDPKYPEMIFVQ